MANKLRHIAISVRDPEKTAKFFEEAFGMTRAGNAQRVEPGIPSPRLQLPDQLPHMLLSSCRLGGDGEGGRSGAPAASGGACGHAACS